MRAVQITKEEALKLAMSDGIDMYNEGIVYINLASDTVEEVTDMKLKDASALNEHVGVFLYIDVRTNGKSDRRVIIEDGTDGRYKIKWDQ